MTPHEACILFGAVISGGTLIAGIVAVCLSWFSRR